MTPPAPKPPEKPSLPQWQQISKTQKRQVIQILSQMISCQVRSRQEAHHEPQQDS
ncbi:MAG: hypothetical protein ACE5ET_10635 [Gammaproteobacteria bacterium]